MPAGLVLGPSLARLAADRQFSTARYVKASALNDGEEALRFTQRCDLQSPLGLALKVSDEFTVPLCAIHHQQNHGRGDERLWWQNTRLIHSPSTVRTA
jgi:hypothetical protein